MTRKDYRLIAAHIETVLTTLPEHGDIRMDLVQRAAALAVVHKVADALRCDNVRFDRDIFLKACGVS